MNTKFVYIYLICVRLCLLCVCASYAYILRVCLENKTLYSSVTVASYATYKVDLRNTCAVEKRPNKYGPLTAEMADDLQRDTHATR